METRHKILMLDDDDDWLDVCREFLGQLPSKPEIHTVSSGTRALALLDAQPFRLLICDLKMPRMDGLQVMAIVRRRFPDLRTVVLTGMDDDEFRSRAYALGVDLFWLKPEMQRNTQLFLDCIESLLGRLGGAGFRSTQRKSIMDIVQMECASHASSVLRFTSGSQVARLWIKEGELIDAEAAGTTGEQAFRRILQWDSGAFETLPAEPGHQRTISKSAEALLVEFCQTADTAITSKESEHRKFVDRMTVLAYEGAEFVVSVPASNGTAQGWGTQNVQPLAAWTNHAQKSAQRLGERLAAGPLACVAGQYQNRRVAMLPQKEKNFLVGWPPNTSTAHLVERTKKIATAWQP
jgi:CheY-like chemotaxis protein